jgi:hypothetical protein
LTNRHLLGLLAAFIGLVVVAVVPAWLIAGENYTLLIAIYAAIVATVSGFTRMLKDAKDMVDKAREERKKEEEKQERVLATVDFKPYDTDTPHLGVELFNDGSRPVTIKRVVMVLKNDAGEKTDRFVMLPNYQEQVKLEPGTPTEFFSHGRKEFKPQTMKELPPEAFWIVVESYKGEVARVEGPAILEAITGRPKPTRLEIGVGEPTRFPEI